jgi:hypothetical protein
MPRRAKIHLGNFNAGCASLLTHHRGRQIREFGLTGVASIIVTASAQPRLKPFTIGTALAWPFCQCKKKPRHEAEPNLAQKLVIYERYASLATAWIDGRRKRQHDGIYHVDDAVRSRNVRHDDVSAATELILEDAVGLFETRAKQGAYRIR